MWSKQNCIGMFLFFAAGVAAITVAKIIDGSQFGNGWGVASAWMFGVWCASLLPTGWRYMFSFKND